MSNPVDLMAALEASLAHAKIKLWICPNGAVVMPGLHRVEWIGPIARCLDCGRTNAEDVAAALDSGRPETYRDVARAEHMTSAYLVYADQQETDLVVLKPSWVADNGSETAVFPTREKALDFCLKRWNVRADEVRTFLSWDEFHETMRRGRGATHE